jgi:hypothetical protein
VRHAVASAGRLGSRSGPCPAQALDFCSAHVRASVQRSR